MQAALASTLNAKHCNFNVSRCVSLCLSLCVFHCVRQRRARFTARFTAFHSAARISLQLKSLPWQVPMQRYKIFLWSCKSSTRLREPPELAKKSLQAIDYF